MAKKKAKGFRVCRVEATSIFKDEERSIRLGPGLLIAEHEFEELVARGVVNRSWFDEVIGPSEGEEV